MAYESYHKRKVGNRQLKPETQMMGYGYDPKLSEGALKPPVFLTSTFVFESAQDGKDFFDYTSGRREPPPGESAGLVYSRSEAGSRRGRTQPRPATRDAAAQPDGLGLWL